jgi:fucose permease
MPFASGARRSLSAFFLSGLLFALPGAILPAWGHHIHSGYTEIGWYFFSMNLGVLISMQAAKMLLKEKSIQFVLALSSGMGAGALLFLAAASGPVDPLWHIGGLFLIGLSLGLMHSGVFVAISPLYTHNPAATVNIAGAMFGLGALVTSLLVAGTFYIYTVPSILCLIAVIPGFFTVFFARSKFQAEPKPPAPTMKESFAAFGSFSGVLFLLLLFFQFGSEWAIAGWLPLFLSQRLGVSPASSIFLLAFYWFSLLVGRVVAQAVLPRINHAKLLFGATSAALFGSVLLTATNNLSGAFVGLLLVGAGFAPIYPLVVEKIGDKFPYYRPGYVNGIFSFAISGGLLAPWSLGFLTESFGIGAVMAIPMLGTCMVFILTSLLWLEMRFSVNVK